MRLNDALIEKLTQTVNASGPHIYPYDSMKIWQENEHFELVLRRDMAYELGAGGKPSVNCTCVTSNQDFLQGDRVLVCGKDLQELKEDTPYARISMVSVRELPELEGDTERLYQMLQDIDFVKYHVFPQGYMMRNSGQTNREQVRIGKKELESGMTFAAIGNTFIRHYRENPNVLAAQVIFITERDAPYTELEKASEQIAQIRKSLSMINKGMPTECSVCGIREICSEVEGLRKLHFGRKEKGAGRH